MAAMTWERRLRDMILAGGALSAVACGSSSSDSNSYFECCNATRDPCCSLGYCPGGVGPHDPRYLACEQGWTECEAMQGAYEPDADGSFACAVKSTGPIGAGSASAPTDAAPPDAGPADTGLADAAEDAPGD
jgi:hypothetical protein